MEKSRKDKEPQDSDPGQVAVPPPCSQMWAIMELVIEIINAGLQTDSS